MRGNSFVSFQGMRMQEIREGSKTKYENNFLPRGTMSHNDKVKFTYINNDGSSFENELSIPRFVNIKTHSIVTDYQEKKTIIKFNWNFNDANVCKDSQKCTPRNARVFVKVNASRSNLEINIAQNPAQLEIDYTEGHIRDITLCSSITRTANGAGTGNKKSSIYCDEKQFL